METPQSNMDDWRTEVTEAKNTVKVRDGDVIKGVFMNEGIKRSSEDYGESIAFDFKIDGEAETKTWFVKANNFSLLQSIKQMGKLTGTHVQISRIGATKSTTRYSIKKID